MTDLLDKIDASLEEVEEQLLSEYNRIRNTVSADRYATIDTGVRNALSEVTDHLHHELAHSGDTTNLQLVSERHEVLYTRIAVLRQLLATKVPTAFLEEAHDGVETRRRRLETRVMNQRRKLDPKVTRQGEERKSGLLSNLRGMFDSKPSEQQLERNTIKVTQAEEKQLEDVQVYLDNGIYSASRELAILASLVRGGTIDQPGDGDMRRGRAVFESRELSHTIPPVNKIRPVAEKEDSRPRPQAEEAAPAKRDIAQTPEEIRRKLEARRNQASDNQKAVFTARDVSGNPPPEMPRREPTRPNSPEAPRAGKATFVSRDIEPAMPQGHYGRPRNGEKKRDETEKEEEKKPRSGKAIFEARDLSNTPFPKKD